MKASKTIQPIDLDETTLDPTVVTFFNGISPFGRGTGPFDYVPIRFRGNFNLEIAVREGLEGKELADLVSNLKIILAAQYEPTQPETPEELHAMDTDRLCLQTKISVRYAPQEKINIAVNKLYTHDQ